MAGQAQDDILLDVRDLRVYFADDERFIRAVDGVDFQVARNQHVGIAGESGSGKTQTAMAVMGLTSGRPGIVTGRIEYGGASLVGDMEKYCRVRGNPIHTVEKNVKDFNADCNRRMAGVRGRRMAMMFQEPRASMSPYFRVREQMTEQLKHCRNGGGAEIRSDRDIETLLHTMNFKDARKVLNAYPHELSGGECQRVMLAMSLASSPELLIADEPTTALDALTQYQIIQLFLRLKENRSFAMLFITHDLALLQLLTDYIIIMYQGRIVEMGPRRAIMQSPGANHPYTEALLRSAREDITYIADMTAGSGRTVRNRGCDYAPRCLYYRKTNRKCDREEIRMIRMDQKDHWVACPHTARRKG
jgi:ABC-type dipeptide/oligopeptide/nickel transport system ATPase component